jgi:hypothetical protein
MNETKEKLEIFTNKEELNKSLLTTEGSKKKTLKNT